MIIQMKALNTINAMDNIKIQKVYKEHVISYDIENSKTTVEYKGKTLVEFYSPKKSGRKDALKYIDNITKQQNNE